MYRIRRSTQFKKDIKRMLKRGKNLEQMLTVVQHLAEEHALDAVYLDHPLKGQYHGKRDCHLEPDWILIYAIEDQEADEIEEKRIALQKTSGFEKQYHHIVRHYFGGMFLHLRSLKPFLKRHAKLAYVVGDQMSFFRTHIPTAALLAEIAEYLGFRVLEIELWRRRLATATKQQIDENVLILENPDGV